MSTIKFTDSTTPSKFTLAKKQYEVTCGHQVTNSDFLNLLLEGYLVTLGTPSKVSTSTPQGIHEDFISRREFEDMMNCVNLGGESMYKMILNLTERVTSLES